jgi:hypothetical protein
MSHKVGLLDVFEGKQYQKVILLVSVLAFLLLELLIFMAAAGQAGTRSRLVVLDTSGNKIFETSGTTATKYQQFEFENNYGPWANYQKRLESDSLPFPFRAWLSAAVGIPVGLTLLVAFLVRIYIALMYGDEWGKGEEPDEPLEKRQGLGGFFNAFQRVTVFHIGFFTVIGVLLFWIVPNFLQDFARISAAAVQDYKWFFLGASIFLAVIITWVIYLRYRLSKQMLENQLHVEKYRLETQLLAHRETAGFLPNPLKEAEEP